MAKAPFSGVLVPVLTPFREDLSPDADRLLDHARWLLEQGVDGLAPFGTTSEANSLSVAERRDLLTRLVEGGLDPDRLMPGTGCCAFSDTVELTAHAVELGCRGVLMLPPFYYKGVSDDGLFAAYAEVIERVASDALRVYLYHIPPLSGVPLSAALVERLADAYPGTVAGLKDSSGDWVHTAALLERFPGLAIFSGSEEYLLATLRNGGAGCISATANVNPAAICLLRDRWRGADAEALQAGVSAVRAAVQGHPLIPALKAVVAAGRGDEEWLRVRPPLVPLGRDQRAALDRALLSLGFSMGGTSS